MNGLTHRLAISALSNALQTLRPELAITSSGYVRNWADNLIPGTDPVWFQAELAQGDGRELEGKFNAAHSSSALVVNTFARFKPSPNLLSIGPYSQFDSFRFEAKCSAGIQGNPPNLDLLAQGGVVLGVESKCTEHLERRMPKFAVAYDEQIKDEARRNSAWFHQMRKLRDVPTAYCYLDVAQLTKHAFGLAHTFPNRETRLFYLFWEPRNALDFREFETHRDEVMRFTEQLKGASPSFEAMSYRQLWDQWSHTASPNWLHEHVAILRKRYDIKI